LRLAQYVKIIMAAGCAGQMVQRRFPARSQPRRPLGKRGCTEFLATKLVTMTRWGVKCLNAPHLVALLFTEAAVWVNHVNNGR